MNIVIFDTETTSLDKPFCYNIGMVGYNTETDEILFEREWVIEQVWYNLSLFASSYYAEKRPIYVNSMRGKTARLIKFGRATSQMRHLFKQHNIEYAYAYNSNFDGRVFEFNCDWYKCINPFDVLPILDIRGNVHKVIAFSTMFQDWSDKHEAYTEAGHYSTTAENVYRYITEDIDFIEDHTALSDSQIELEILKYCVDAGTEYGVAYKTYASVPRQVERICTIKHMETGEIYELPFKKITISKDRNKIILR